MNTDSMQRVADRFAAAVENADRGALEALYASDAIVWHNYDNREKSRDDSIAAITNFPKLFKSFKYTNVRRAFFEGGFVQQLVVRGVKADGQAFAVPVCMVIALRGEQITRIDEYFDSAQDARPAQYR